MKISTKLLRMFSAFCAFILLGLTANAQSITVSGGLTANQMAQLLVGSNVTVSNAVYTGAATASGSFNQGSSTFPLANGIILTSGSRTNALGPNNSTGASASNGTPGDAALTALAGGVNTFDAAILEFDITSNCNTVTFDYIFASEEYPEYACSNFNDVFGFFITGPGYAPNTNIALVPGTSTPVSINNVINSPSTNCVSNPTFYVNNANGLSIQYDGRTVTLTATASIQPCQTYHIKIAVADAGDSALDSAVFLKGGGINCSSPNLTATANITNVGCGVLGAIDLTLGSGTGPFTYAWTGPNNFTATTQDLTGLAAGVYTVTVTGANCLSSGQFTYTVAGTVDVTPPVFTNCPSNITIQAANPACTFAVNVPTPTVSDNCPNVTVTSTPAPGTPFSVGTTPVTYTATDAAGNSSTCTFNVIVNAQPLVVTLTPLQYAGGVNIKCFGQFSGQVTAGAAGGCYPYTYSWINPITGLPMSQTVATPAPVVVPGLPAGPFTMTVTDGNLTTVTQTVTLIQNPPVQAVVTQTPILCNGGTSTVVITAQAGTSPYNGLTTYNVFPGTYIYLVTDANGCRNRDTIVVTQPAILDATATPTPILCWGDTSQVTVAATGGTAPYTGTGVFNQVAGVYTYVVTDANGCTDNTQLAVNQPQELTATISSTPILCYGGTSQVTVSVASGTEPYTGTGVFTEYAGNYTYTVYDYNLCEDTISITVTEPSDMVTTVSATPILCAGGTTNITVTGSGGTGAWNGTGTFTETAGTYGYSLLDANGCTDSVSVTVNEPTQLVASISSTSILCNGGSSDITVTATGGTAPYTGTGVYSETAGTHTYTVTDANGCSVTVSTTVTEPAALSASVSSTSIDCAGGSSDITVTATGGTSPYTGTGVYSQTAGTYMYTVTDANGCSVTVSTTVTEPTALSASISSTSIDCAGGSSDITVTATGGTAPYTGTGVYTEAAGTYTYTVTDANGCSVTVSTTVTEPAQLLVSLSSAGIACNGGSADITVSATGGTAPYTGTGIFNVGTGTYTYTVTDANGCSASESITIVEPTLMTAYVSCPAPIACNGGTADIAVFAFGGTAPYTGIGVFTVGAGTYTYTVTDANGCTSTVSHTVTEPAPVNVSIASSGIACNGGSSNLTVSATGGTAPYTGTGTFNVTAGTYSYTITDANGCTGTATITVAAPAPLVASATAAPILCFGGTANVTVSATGGTAPYTGTGIFNVGAGTYTYTVTDANGCSATTSVTLTQPTLMTAYASCPMIACNGGTADLAVFAFGGTAPYSGIGVFNVGAGTYTYTVTDANGCTASVTHTVTQPAPVNVSIVSSGINCNGGTANLTVSATGGTAPYTGTGTFNVSAGTYSYTITDANGCTGTATITVAAPAPLVASASAGSILCFGGTANVTVSATGGTAPYTGTGTFNVAAGTYTYTVTDSKGCTATTSVTLTQPTQMTAYASCPVIACNGGTANLAVFAFGGTAPYTGTGVFTVGAGTYTYTVTDANGCTSTVTHTVTQPAALVATATVSNLNCANGTGNVTIAATGGTAPYTGTGLFVQANGTQTYTVTDAKGCVTTVSATVVIQNFVNLTCPGNQTFACASTQSCGQSSNGATISWTAPTASSYNSCNNGCGSNTAIPGFMYMGEYNGSRYYCSSTSNFGWQAANTAANNAGGHLVTIQSPAENQFVKNLIGAQEVWIGFTDQNVEGTFQWINGESVGYTNWASTDPDNSGPLPSGCTNCGQADYTIMKKTSGSWLDRFECEKHEFVMEIPCGNPITITQTAGPANGSFANGGTSQVVTYVAVDQVTGASATCSFTVTVGQCAPVYCQSSASCTSYEWIKKVTLGSINNQSGNNGGYANFTALSTTATVGSVVNLQLTPGFASTVYTEAWRVWIDWNYDGDFNDQGEMVYQGTGTSVMNGSFTVPSFATLNTNLRVRVSMRWDCYAGPCSSFQYGEVEDYTIIIQPGPGAMATVIGQADGRTDMKQGKTAIDNVKMYEDVIEDGSTEGGYGLELGDIYPNPVLSSNGKVNLDVRTGSETDISVRIYDLSGKILLTENVHLELGANKSAIDVTGFARGSYIIEVTNGELRETTQLIVQ